MSIAEKRRIILAKEDKNLTKLAELLGSSLPKLWKIMERDNFSEKI